MIRKHGNQMVEKEKYDKKYRLKQIRWPETFAAGGCVQVERLDEFSHEVDSRLVVRKF